MYKLCCVELDVLKSSQAPPKLQPLPKRRTRRPLAVDVISTGSFSCVPQAAAPHVSWPKIDVDTDSFRKASI